MSLKEVSVELKRKKFKELYGDIELVFNDENVVDKFIDSIYIIKKEASLDESVIIHKSIDDVYTVCGLLVEHNTEELDKAVQIICYWKDLVAGVSDTLRKEATCIFNISIAARRLAIYNK